jgi:excisionase family DNA binding protein
VWNCILKKSYITFCSLWHAIFPNIRKCALPCASAGPRPWAAIPFAQRRACTIAEACEVTGLARTKLYELIGDGLLATTTVGRRRLVLVQSLLSLIEAKQSQTGAEPTPGDSRPIRLHARILTTRPSSRSRSNSSAHQRIMRTRSC